MNVPRAFAIIAFGLLGATVNAEGPPTENGQITNSALKANQDVTKAQAVMSIESFMSKGSKTCDSSGNCRSMFGSDGAVDYGSLQSKAEGLTGASAATLDSSSESSSVATQTAEFALKCSQVEPVVKSGVALKMLSCSVAENGNASVTFQVCTAPSRGNPIANEPNAVPCSTDPKSPDYRPPEGFVCLKTACNSEPQGSRDGWSAPQTAVFVKSSKDEKNGLALVLYPNPSAGVAPDFKTDADTLTAVKVVDSYRQPSTGVQSVGLRLAYRYKRQVTKEMLSGEGPKLANPGSYSSQWRTVEMLNDNKQLSAYQNKYGSNASACLTQLQSGMKGDGTIYVCDQNYDVNGIRPGAKQAQISVDGQSCTSTTQCVQEVVKTNSWSQVCTSPVPLATRECVTSSNYDIYTKDAVSHRALDTCVETRDVSTKNCTVSTTVTDLAPRCSPGTWVNQNSGNAEFGAGGADRMVARYYCDPAGATSGAPLQIQVYAYGGRGACIGWQTVTVDFSKPNTMNAAASLAPHWGGNCNYDVRVDVSVTKTCNNVDTTCRANLFFYHDTMQYSGPATYSCDWWDNCSYTCPAGQTLDVSGDYPYCTAPYKQGIANLPMEFVRPGYTVKYDAPVNTCTELEATP